MDFKDWTQQELADASGLSKPQICHVLKENRMPKLLTLHKISRALGVSIIKLYEET